MRSLTRVLSILLLLPTPALAGTALHFDGSDDHVTMGDAAGLGLAAFTLECWFRYDGAGAASSTGSGGLDAFPLVSKGRGESDGGTQDMAYFLGVDEATGVLAADFEDMGSGANHPVYGTTPVTDGAWHHAAVTYDGSTWVLYLDGMADGTLDTAGALPRHDSEQHFGVATAMNTNGTPSGHFRGAIDEVRVWSVARDVDAIRSTINDVLGPEDDLVARWGFDEGAGTYAADTVGDAEGTVLGATWVAEAPFDANLPPDPPVLISPDDGGSALMDAILAVDVDDPEGDPLTVRFYGRALPEDESRFTVVALPDTQYYSCGCNDGVPETFIAQTEWIVEQHEQLNAVYVAHLGDCVDHGDSDEEEWINADAAMSKLEDPATTGLAEGIPYGIAVGNHDQSPSGPDGATEFYNQYFGIERFEDRSYYGGHHGDNNDNHYALISASGYDLVVLFLEYDTNADPVVLTWADEILQAHEDRIGIVISHYVLHSSGTFSDQGQAIYDALKERPNFALMMGGHLTAESHRADTWDGHTTHTLLADYQFRDNGGDGWLQMLQFDPAADAIHVQTYSPTLQTYEVDADSEFTLDLPMSTARFEVVGEEPAVEAGGTAQVHWEGLEDLTSYEWYAVVSDGRLTTGARWTFTYVATPGDDDDDDVVDDDDGDDDTGVGDDDSGPGTAGCDCDHGGLAAGGGWLAVWPVLAGLLLGLRRGASIAPAPRSRTAASSRPSPRRRRSPRPTVRRRSRCPRRRRPRCCPGSWQDPDRHSPHRTRSGHPRRRPPPPRPGRRRSRCPPHRRPRRCPGSWQDRRLRSRCRRRRRPRPRPPRPGPARRRSRCPVRRTAPPPAGRRRPRCRRSRRHIRRARLRRRPPTHR